jgi:2-C-methyl-D-erythritol 4-phosphate cytidylyltransferase
MPDPLRIAVIITAAGASSRWSASRNKLDEDLGGRPVLHRTVERFTTRDDVSAVIVAGPHADEAFADFSLRHADRLALLGASLCKGGATHRYETVAAAIEHVPADATHIAVHDAARPAVSPELIDRVFAAAAKHPAVIPALPVADTIKRTTEADAAAAEIDPLDAALGLGGDDAGAPSRVVAQTLDRTDLVAVQTPQVFAADLLRRAYAQGDLSSTDDAALVERLGEPVMVVEGDEYNLKLTRPKDLPIIRAILGFKPPRERETHKKF